MLKYNIFTTLHYSEHLNARVNLKVVPVNTLKRMVECRHIFTDSYPPY